ncbi:acyl-ACP desaturase [Insolitispirillum peregrinum]|uniref:acyl-ACP desaturase n=1 Tax=Insolitispirillum peregrinum TaxID=80876 RepID=UPI0036221138
MAWTLDDIAWDRFDPTKVNPHILQVVKAAALVERNAADYTTYLGNVFHDDAPFNAYAADWRREEEQHGDALGRWAELADPSFNYMNAFRCFTDGYKIATDSAESIRGSRTGELIARCIVETGTSSFYSALRDACDEPVLKDICNRIAGDEFRHYKFFLTAMRDYQQRENVPAWKRFMVAVGRIRESEDDELAFAYHAANVGIPEGYDRETAALNYGARAFSFYRARHVERAAHMVLKAAGLSAQGWFANVISRMLWRFIQRRAHKMSQELQRAA